MKGRMPSPGATLMVLAVLLVAGCGPGKYSPKQNEELFGTWTNEKTSPQVTVNFAGGFKDYSVVGNTLPYAEGTEELTSRWTDADGSIWYKTTGTGTGGSYKGYKWQTLQKISKSGMREMVVSLVSEFSDKNYPTKIDPKDSSYRFYYRTQN